MFNGNFVRSIKGFNLFTLGNPQYRTNLLAPPAALPKTSTVPRDISFAGDDAAHRYISGAGSDTLEGGNGADSIWAGAGDDNLLGGDGNDRLYGGAGNDTIYGEEGNDFIYGQAGDDLIHGDAGNDRLYGGLGNDTLCGCDGDDSLYGEAGNDILNGEAGNDFISAGAGNDTLYGGDGNDTLYGDAGHDLIDGEAGNDFLRGGAGNDTAYGGDGNDTIYGDAGNDLIDGDAGDDFLRGGAGHDTIYGGVGNDTIYGDAGNNVLYGDDDNDLIYGGVGNDTLYGGAGNDTLEGGAGRDSMDGGTGDDTYKFFNSFGIDTVQDSGGTDTLDFSNVTLAMNVNLTTGVATVSKGSVAFQGIEHFIGSKGNDTFIVDDTSVPITIDGGLGNDTVDLSNVSAGNLGNITLLNIENVLNEPEAPTEGTDSDDTFSYGNNFANATIDGKLGTDTASFAAMTGGNPVDVVFTSDYDGTATNSASNTIQFVSIENITGGSGNDSFTLANNLGTHTINGGGGNDTLDLSGALAGNDLTVNFTNNTITNGVDTITFSNMETILTGAGDDTFTLDTIPTALSVDGGTGADALNLSALGASESVSIDLTGNGLGDISASNVETITTGAGDDSFILPEAYANITINGGAGDDTLDLSATGNTVDLTVNLNTGVLNNGSNTVTFSGIETIVAGAGDDTFTLDSVPASLSLNGGSGTDALDMSALDGTEDVVVNFTNSGTGNVHVSNIETITTGAGDDQFLLGDNFANATIIGGAGHDILNFSAATDDLTVNFTAGTATNGSNTIAFTGIEQLVLGNGTNSVIITDGSVPITITGGTGNDTVDISAVPIGDRGNITLVDVENILDGTVPDAVGTDGDDTFDYADNFTSTSIDAKLGTDTLDFSTMTAGNPVDVAFSSAYNGTATNSANEIVQFISIENVIGGADDDSFSFSNTMGNHSINGGAGDDTVDLSAANASNDLTVNLITGEITNSTYTIDIANVETIITGAGDDTFILDSIPANISLDGGSGADALNLSALDASESITLDFTNGGLGDMNIANIESITTGAGNDAFLFGDNFGTYTLAGGAGNDTLNLSALTNGNDATVDFAAGTAIHSGGAGTIHFSGLEAATGGAGDDTFTFANGFGNATVNGGAGSDTIDVSTSSGNLIISFVDNTVTNATHSITFSNLENIISGAGNDTITFNGTFGTHTLDGGAGNDELNLSTVPNGTNTIINASGTTVVGATHIISNIETISGGDGNNTFVFGDSFGNHTVNGGVSGVDTLDFSPMTSGNNVTVNFNTDIATHSAGAGSIGFSHIEVAQGGDGNDTFIFGNGFGTQTIAGGDGNDTADFSLLSAANNMAINLTAGTVNSGNGDIATFSEMETIISGDGDDTFTATNVSFFAVDGGGDGWDTLELSGLNNTQHAVINASGSAFGGTTHNVYRIDEVNTGDGNDTFAFGNNFANLQIDAGNGTNSLDFSAMTSGNHVTVDFTANTATNSAGAGTVSFSDIQNVVGGAGNDTFTFNGSFSTHTLDGGAGNDTLNLSAVPNGTSTVINASGSVFGGTTHTISNIETITGGDGNNTFVFGDNFGAHTVTGGTNGTDTLNFSPMTSGNDLTVNFSTHTATHSAGAGSIAFSAIENAVGGGGNDTFTFGNGFGTISVNGGAGSDTLNFSALDNTNDMDIDFGSGGAVTMNGDILQFSNIENAIGSQGDDTFIVGTLTTRTLDGGSGLDTLDMDALGAGQNAVVNFSNTTVVGTTHTVSNFEYVNTGDGDDRFVFGDNFASMELHGGSGSNTMDFSPLTAGNNVTVNFITRHVTNNIGAGDISFHSGIRHATGGAGDDTFTLANGYGVRTIQGGGGSDTLNLSGMSIGAQIDFAAGTATSGGGSDVITFNSIENIQGGTGDDTYTFDNSTLSDIMIEDANGNDTYEGFGAGGFGDITIQDGGGTDYVDLGGFTQNQVDWEAIGNSSLKLTFDTGDTLTIENYFDNNTTIAGTGRLETLHFSDGDVDFTAVSSLV